MSIHRYDKHSVRADLRRAAMGLILTVGPMLLLGDSAVALAILGVLALCSWPSACAPCCAA